MAGFVHSAAASCDGRKMHLESNNVFKFARIADVSENLFCRTNFIVNIAFAGSRFIVFIRLAVTTTSQCK